MENNNLKSKAFNLDSLGFSASFICAVHYAVLPIVLIFLPLSPLRFLANPLFEIAMIILSVIIGLSSLFPAYYKNHHRLDAILILLSGFAFIFSGHFLVAGRFEPIIIPLGAFAVASSHLVNWKLSDK